MKKFLLLTCFITGFTQNIQSSHDSHEIYQSNEELDQAIDNLHQQLNADLQYQHISDQGESLSLNQNELLKDYYASLKILRDKKLENLSRRLFTETDADTASLMQKNHKIIALIENGLTLYQAEDAVKKNLNHEQALSAAQQNLLDTAEKIAVESNYFGDLQCALQHFRNGEITGTHELRQEIVYFNAGLKLSQAELAAHHNLTLDQALLMKTRLAERNGIDATNGSYNDGYKEIIAQIK